MFSFSLKGQPTSLVVAAKSVIPAVAFAIGMAGASFAHGTTYVLQNGVLEGNRTVNIANLGNVRSTAMQFDGYIDAVVDRPFVNLVAFCVDIYHHIGRNDYDPDLTYTDTNPLATDSNYVNARALLNTEILHISRLVNYGTNVFNNAPTITNTQRNARYDELAAVQGAIWQVVSQRNVTHNNGMGALNTRIDYLANSQTYNSAFNANYGFVHSRVTFITPFKGNKVYPNRDLTQSFAIAAVPEPATWVMMIGGFVIAGGMLRRSRQRTGLSVA